MATATGSELTLEAASGAYGIYAYQPEASEVTLQSATGAYGAMAGTPQSSEATLQSGTPVVQTTTGTIGATGSEMGLEAPGYYDVFYDYEPDGSEASLESGTPVLPTVIGATGSELTAQSGTATITSAALFLNPAGSEATLQATLPSVGTPAAGSQVTLQAGTPFIRGITRPYRATWVPATGYAVAWVGGATTQAAWEGL